MKNETDNSELKVAECGNCESTFTHTNSKRLVKSVLRSLGKKELVEVTESESRSVVPFKPETIDFMATTTRRL